MGALRRGRHAALACAALALAACVLTVPAAGAGETTVTLHPANQTVDRGANATYDVVVTDASGGVGAYNLSVDADGEAVASVASVSIPGDPAMVERSVSDESATVRVIGLDTAQTGAVRVASVTVRTAETNTSGTLSLRIAALGDEAGNSYDVRATEDATLTVGTREENTDDGGAGGSGGSDSTGGTVGTGGSGNAAPGSSTTTTQTTSTTQQTTATTTTQTTSTTTTRRTTATETTATPTQQAPSTTGSSPGLGLAVALGALLLVAGLEARMDD